MHTVLWCTLQWRVYVYQNSLIAIARVYCVFTNYTCLVRVELHNFIDFNVISDFNEQCLLPQLTMYTACHSSCLLYLVVLHYLMPQTLCPTHMSQEAHYWWCCALLPCLLHLCLLHHVLFQSLMPQTPRPSHFGQEASDLHQCWCILPYCNGLPSI